MQPIEVSEVFLNVDDPGRAYVQISPLEDAQSSPGIANAIVPFPVIQIDGRWLLNIPYLTPGDDCPFESEPVRPQATPRPRVAGPTGLIGLGLDFSGLMPPEGVQSPGSGWGGGDGQFEASISLETEMSPSVLPGYYRTELEQPHWTILTEHADDDAGWILWSIRDDADRLWLTGLFAGRAGEGQQRVRFWGITGESVNVVSGPHFDGLPPPAPDTPAQPR